MNHPRHNHQQPAPLAPRADATAARQSEREGQGRPLDHPPKPSGCGGVVRLSAIDDLVGVKEQDREGPATTPPRYYRSNGRARSMKTNAERCQHVKADGARCQARKVHASDYCFFHDPARAAERAAARQAGGRKGKAAVLPPDTPLRPVRTAGDVVELLAETIHQVRTGTLDPRVGNCIGYLSAIVLKATEQGEMEQRLAALENIVAGQGRPESLFDADPDRLLTDHEDAEDLVLEGANA